MAKYMEIFKRYSDSRARQAHCGFHFMVLSAAVTFPHGCRILAALLARISLSALFAITLQAAGGKRGREWKLSRNLITPRDSGRAVDWANWNLRHFWRHSRRLCFKKTSLELLFCPVSRRGAGPAVQSRGLASPFHLGPRFSHFNVFLPGLA